MVLGKSGIWENSNQVLTQHGTTIMTPKLWTNQRDKYQKYIIKSMTKNTSKQLMDLGGEEGLPMHDVYRETNQ